MLRGGYDAAGVPPCGAERRAICRGAVAFARPPERRRCRSRRCLAPPARSALVPPPAPSAAAASSPPSGDDALPSPPPPQEPSPTGWTRTQLLAFAGTYTAYAACYLARNNSAVAKAALGLDLGIDVDTLGLMDASFLTAYTLGSFALGPLTDVVGAWPCLMAGLGGVGAVQALLAWPGGPATAVPLAALYAANGLLQSALYPACKKVMAEHFGEKSRGSALGSWSSCYYLGSIVSTGVASQVLAAAGGGAGGSWRAVFMAPAALLPMLALALIPLAAALPSAAPPPAAASESSVSADAPASGGFPGSLLEAYPAPIWVCSLSYAVIKCARYAFLLWLPLYLINDAGMSLGAAGATAALFDAGSIAGSLIAGQLSDRLGQQAGLASAMLAPLSVLLFAFPSVATGSLSAVPGALPATVLLLGLLIGGPETLQGSVAPLRYAPPARRAAAVGFVNGWGSAGTVFAAPLIPAVAARVGGMEHAFALLGPLAAMAGAITFLQWAVYDAKEDAAKRE